MDKDEALKLALEVLEDLQGGCTDSDDGTIEAITVCCPEVITAIKAVLAQPEQEPVAMRYDFDGYGWLYIDNGSGSNWREKIKNAEPLYTAPPQRQPDQEPVAWNVVDPTGKIVATEMNSVRGWARIEGYKPTVEGLLGFHEQGWRVVPTTPPRREWVGLTVREIEWCFYDANDARIVAARNIEAKLREKNGG